MKKFWVVALALVVHQASAHAFEGCREKIPSRVFALNQETGEYTPITDPAITNIFLEAYDLFPAPVQAMMCSFEKFGLYHDNAGASASSDMSFRRAPFDQALGAEQWMTWKDQLNFGTPNTNEFQNDPALAHVEVDARIKNVKFLYFLLVHEIGHNVERSWDFEKRWNALHELPENEFEGKSLLCSYWCEPGKSVPTQKTESVYGDLFSKTNFLSLYTTRNEEEDFADSFAFYVATQISGYSYDIVLPNGTRHGVREKMGTPIFAEKLAMLKEIYGTLPVSAVRDGARRSLILRIEE